MVRRATTWFGRGGCWKDIMIMLGAAALCFFPMLEGRLMAAAASPSISSARCRLSLANQDGFKADVLKGKLGACTVKKLHRSL